MDERTKESLRVYFTSVAASVSSLFIFYKLIPQIQSNIPTFPPTIAPISQSFYKQIWKPLSNKEIEYYQQLNQY